MTNAELARNIAQSLTLGAWSRSALEGTLRRRLPAPLQNRAPALAADLMEALPALYAPAPKVVASTLKDLPDLKWIVRYCQRHAISPGPDLTSPAMVPLPVFADLDIPQLPTLGALADWFLLPIERLDYMADLTSRHEEHGDMAVNHYHTHLHPKKSGGTRVIEAPKETLKSIQRLILSGILDCVPTHRATYGFVKGRSCIDAAKRHVAAEVVICFDMKDFFPSISTGRVFGLFRCLGYPINVAKHLTALCTTVTPSRVRSRLNRYERQTYRAPHLPQGAPTSPALANQIAFNLDRRLCALAASFGATYTRYADDLTFSGDQHITKVLLSMVPQIVEKEGFTLNARKTRVMPRTTRQIVTGIVVNQHLNIRRDTFDRLKAVIHSCGKPGDTRLGDPAFCAALLGKIDWVETLNPKRGRKLRQLLYSAATGARR